MTEQQAIEALHALPRMGQSAPGLARPAAPAPQRRIPGAYAGTAGPPWKPGKAV